MLSKPVLQPPATLNILSGTPTTAPATAHSILTTPSSMLLTATSPTQVVARTTGTRSTKRLARAAAKRPTQAQSVKLP